MSSVKIVLRKKVNKDGTYPLAIRITKDRKSSYVHLGHHIEETAWDAKNCKVKKSHPNAVRLNNLLLKKLSEAEDIRLDMEIQKNDTSSRAMKNRLQVSKESSFFTNAEAYLADLKKEGKYNRYSTDKGKVSVFKQFLDGSDISFGTYASIVGGQNNKITGKHSAILGGINSCDNNYNCVGIYGQGIVANGSNMFFVNQVNISTICSYTGGTNPTPGTVFKVASGSTPPLTACPLYIM